MKRGGGGAAALRQGGRWRGKACGKWLGSHCGANLERRTCVAPRQSCNPGFHVCLTQVLTAYNWPEEYIKYLADPAMVGAMWRAGWGGVGRGPGGGGWGVVHTSPTEAQPAGLAGVAAAVLVCSVRCSRGLHCRTGSSVKRWLAAVAHSCKVLLLAL